MHISFTCHEYSLCVCIGSVDKFKLLAIREFMTMNFIRLSSSPNVNCNRSRKFQTSTAPAEDVHQKGGVVPFHQNCVTRRDVCLVENLCGTEMCAHIKRTRFGARPASQASGPLVRLRRAHNFNFERVSGDVRFLGVAKHPRSPAT